ncbi:unannotated protein [freshwater metagenome]|uniref:Unannotated protein n=1 Tax=freshwater metagenome TaxID=449393 RepID=A0A6J7P9I1_9ZZZZ
MPMRSERVMRRRMRAVMRIAMTPRIETAMRQPKGVAPKKYSPAAIVHFPRGGWTTYSGPSLKMSIVRQLPSDARSVSFAPSAMSRSTPKRSMERASLT